MRDVEIPNLKCEDCKLRFVPLILGMIDRIEGDHVSQGVIYDTLGSIYVHESKMHDALNAYQKAVDSFEAYDGEEDVSTMKSSVTSQENRQKMSPLPPVFDIGGT